MLVPTTIPDHLPTIRVDTASTRCAKELAISGSTFREAGSVEQHLLSVHIASNKYLLDTRQRKFSRTFLDDRTREADAFDDALRLAD